MAKQDLTDNIALAAYKLASAVIAKIIAGVNND